MDGRLKLYFIGSGNIAQPILEALAKASGIELLGIGSQEDRPAGRQKKMTPTPVARWAEEHSLEVDKIPSVNSIDFLDKLRSLAPEIILIVSFGQILKEELLNLPKIGCVNIHSSLLPFYRGAAPIAAALLNGDTKTGVAFMEVTKGLDAGPVYRLFEHPLTGKEKADSLELDLGELAAKHAETTLLEIASGKLKPIPQNEEEATYIGKIKKKAGNLDWNEQAEIIERKVRAYFPWPGVSFTLKLPSRESKIRITEAECMPEMSGKPGEILKADKADWIVACGAGALKLGKVVPQGKKEMSGPDFLRGCPIRAGAVLQHQQG